MESPPFPKFPRSATATPSYLLLNADLGVGVSDASKHMLCSSTVIPFCVHLFMHVGCLRGRIVVSRMSSYCTGVITEICCKLLIVSGG